MYLALALVLAATCGVAPAPLEPPVPSVCVTADGHTGSQYALQLYCARSGPGSCCLGDRYWACNAEFYADWWDQTCR